MYVCVYTVIPVCIVCCLCTCVHTYIHTYVGYVWLNYNVRTYNCIGVQYYCIIDLGFRCMIVTVHEASLHSKHKGIVYIVTVVETKSLILPVLLVLVQVHRGQHTSLP